MYVNTIGACRNQETAAVCCVNMGHVVMKTSCRKRCFIQMLQSVCLCMEMCFIDESKGATSYEVKLHLGHRCWSI